MRVYRSLVAVLFGLGLHAGALARPIDEAGPPKTVVLRVEGMSCGSCAGHVESALKRVEGVTTVLVSYGKGEALVTFDPARVQEEKLAAAVTAAGYKASTAASCGTPPVAERKEADCWMEQVAGLFAPQAERLSDEQMERLVSYVAQQVLTTENYEPDKEQIEKATGVTIPESEEMRVQAAVIAKLIETPEGRAKLDGEGRCADYGACSMHGNLNGAAGEELDTYVREKAEDGRTYDGVALPEFEAQALDGTTVRSADLRGRPTLLVVMTGFCNHSIQSLPVLRETVRTWAPRGLRVVGVFANSGPPEELGQWLPDFRPEFDVWVKSDADFGDVLGSHMVPTYLYVDAAGQVRKKFVGYHTAEEVQEPLAALVGQGAASRAQSAGSR